MRENLEVCPFCGGEASVVHIYGGEQGEGERIEDLSCVIGYIIECKNCNAATSIYFDTEDEAINAWNSRKMLIHRRNNEN